MTSFYCSSILEIAHMGIAHIPSHYHLTSHSGGPTAGYCVQVASFKKYRDKLFFFHHFLIDQQLVDIHSDCVEGHIQGKTTYWLTCTVLVTWTKIVRR